MYLNYSNRYLLGMFLYDIVNDKMNNITEQINFINYLSHISEDERVYSF